MMTKRKEFDLGLEELNAHIVDMGQRVEKSIGEAMVALINLDVNEAVRIIAQDKELNRIEERISQLGAALIATQQPVAKDLRRILVAFKIATDLERMGDFSVDIAKVIIRLEGQTLIKPLYRPAANDGDRTNDDPRIDSILRAGKCGFSLQNG